MDGHISIPVLVKAPILSRRSPERAAVVITCGVHTDRLIELQGLVHRGVGTGGNGAIMGRNIFGHRHGHGISIDNGVIYRDVILGSLGD